MSLACDTLGFTFSRDTADYGLEGYYNSSLTGADGRQYGYFQLLMPMWSRPLLRLQMETVWKPVLDLGIQQIVEKWVTCFSGIDYRFQEYWRDCGESF